MVTNSTHIGLYGSLALCGSGRPEQWGHRGQRSCRNKGPRSAHSWSMTIPKHMLTRRSVLYVTLLSGECWGVTFPVQRWAQFASKKR